MSETNEQQKQLQPSKEEGKLPDMHQLMTLVQAGDKEAFTKLLMEHWKKMRQ